MVVKVVSRGGFIEKGVLAFGPQDIWLKTAGDKTLALPEK